MLGVVARGVGSAKLRAGDRIIADRGPRRRDVGAFGMLERIRVRGYKSLHDVDVRFRPLLVVFGPNAAGKSNFVESLLLLSRIVTEQTLRDAFDEPLRGHAHEQFSVPETGLAGLLAQKESSLALEADLAAERTAESRALDRLRYRIEVGIRPAGELVVRDEYLARLKRDGGEKGSPRIQLGEGRDGGPPRVVVRRLGRAGHPTYEERGLGHALVSNRQYGGATRYPDFDRLRAELSSWRTYYLDPRTAMRAPQAPKEVYDIGARGEWLAPFLYRLQVHAEHGRRFAAVRRALQTAIPSVDQLDVTLDERRGTLDITVVQDGTPFSSRVISEGTLRVLALCALAANPWPGALVAFEEPESGVHPRRVEVVARLLLTLVNRGHRQVVVTTHSPALVKALLHLQRQDATARDTIGLLRCGQSAGHTTLSPFDADLPLFHDRSVQEALKAPEDDRVIEEMLTRGWVDD